MISFIKRNKLFSFLIFFTFISILLGIFFYSNIPSSKADISHNIYQLFSSQEPFFSKYFLRYGMSFFLVWLFGFSIIGFLFVILLYFYQVFLFSFEVCSMISILGISKILYILLYFLPNIFLLILFFLLCFYSISFSSYLFRFLFFRKQYSFQMIMIRYSKIFFFAILSFLLMNIIHMILISYLSNIF